jgi:hypothetical protein
MRVKVTGRKGTSEERLTLKFLRWKEEKPGRKRQEARTYGLKLKTLLNFMLKLLWYRMEKFPY